MQASINHIEHSLGGPSTTGSSTHLSSSHPSPTSKNPYPHPYGDRQMHPPTNPSNCSDPNKNSGRIHHSSAADPAYGQCGKSTEMHVPRNTGGNPACGAFSVKKTPPPPPQSAQEVLGTEQQPTKKKNEEKAFTADTLHPNEAGMGSLDRLDNGKPYNEARETLSEDYGYSDAGLVAGGGTGVGVSKVAASASNREFQSLPGGGTPKGGGGVEKVHSDRHVETQVRRD